MENPTELTEIQANVLAFIENEITRSGRPPSLRDIAKHFKYRAVASVQQVLAALRKKGYLESSSGAHCDLRPKNFAQSLSVPILGSVPAGKPIEAIHDAQGFISVPAKLRGELFALKVTGESMIEAGIFDGDLVIVKKQHQAENGDIVVAMIDDEATVKVYEKRAGRIRLLPRNPRFQPIELQSGRENTIQGKVISVQRYY